MQDLIAQYREQLALLKERKRQLTEQKKGLRGREYFLALRRLDLLEQECLELTCTLAYMVKEYAPAPPAKSPGHRRLQEKKSKPASA